MTCPPFKIEVGGTTKYESEHLLYKTPKRLIRHFSPRWERELMEKKTSNRIHVPFPKQPVKLVVGWMMAGGGNNIGTVAIPYPHRHRENLQVLHRCVVYLEIDQLIERVKNDMERMKPAIPRMPAAMASRKTETPVPPKLCWYCNKTG